MFDVIVIGSGLGGSVAATLLAKLGYSVLMLERTAHPKFAIGESTTPVMSKKIRHLGYLYQIPEFVQLSSYDRIIDANLPITCGPKELFHYFWHEPGQTCAEPDGEVREIVVQTPEVDTQLLRADSDAYLVQVACKYGVDYRDHTAVEDIEFRSDCAQLRCCDKSGSVFEISARFVIDATGFKSLIAERLDLQAPVDTPLKSRSIFTHFEGLLDFEAACSASPEFAGRPPVGRERATQHHCFDGGWIWLIPFGNGVTSVGLNLDIDVWGTNDLPAEAEFWQIVEKFPIIHAMLDGRKTLMPFIKTGRLQFCHRQLAGERWAMLPASGVGIDAWFSTGLASTVIGAHRIVDILHQRVLPTGEFSAAHFDNYQTAVFKEWATITKMVNGIYKSFKHFDVFKHYCFFCFMGAETYVHSGGYKRPHDMNSLLLSAGDPEFQQCFEEFYEMVIELNQQATVPTETIEYMREFVQRRMLRFNRRDYGNPLFQGVFRRTEDDDDHYPQAVAPSVQSAAISQLAM